MYTDFRFVISFQYLHFHYGSVLQGTFIWFLEYRMQKKTEPFALEQLLFFWRIILKAWKLYKLGEPSIKSIFIKPNTFSDN